MRVLKSIVAIGSFVLALCYGAPSYAQLFVAPSCGSLRFDWRPTNASPQSFTAQVQFRVTGTPNYGAATTIPQDPNDRGIRGVIPNLQPNTTYDVKVTLNSTPPESAEKLGTTTVESQFIPTFHSVGMCWAPNGKGASVRAAVKFKPAGAPDSAYRQGLDLWYDARTNFLRNAEYRGSLVDLQPGTAYDIQLTLGTGAPQTISNAVRTWSEVFPERTPIPLSQGVTKLIISPADITEPTSSASGGIQTINVPASESTSTYTVVTGSPGQNVIDQSSLASPADHDGCVIVRQGTHHVIIRGLQLKNCQRDAIFIERQSSPILNVQTHDIVIEDNEIFGWGGRGQDDGRSITPNPDPLQPNLDGAIFCGYNRETADPIRPDRIIIQRNTIRDPRWSSTPWGPGTQRHPWGPEPVNFDRCGTNHVIRYNDMYSTNGNFFCDGIGGGENFSTRGFPNADSDIYGNRISQVYDDGIESEGGNRNVRIWGNYLDRTMVAIGNAHTSVGPLYVWRNVSNDQSQMQDPAATADAGVRGSFVKTVSSGNTPFNGGRAYFFHNTVLQKPNPAGLFTLGAGRALGDADANTPVPFFNFVSRANIWLTYRPRKPNGGTDYSIEGSCDPNANPPRPCDADWDLYNGKIQDSLQSAGPNAEVNGWGNPTLGDPNSAPTFLNADPASGGRYPAGIPATDPNNPTFGTGDFRLAASSLGTINVPLIPNFNDLDGTRHVGAQPPSKDEMRFGVSAATTPGSGPTALLTATPTSGRAPLTVAFDAGGSSAGTNPISTYSIDFGDNTSGTGVKQTHTYTAPGSYPAMLTVTDSAGRTSNVFTTITVTVSGPTAALTASPLSGPAPLTVTFDASGSTQGSAPISTYSIDFGDKTSGSGAQQTHTYSALGTYTATLTVTDGNKLTSTDSKTIQVTDSVTLFSGPSTFGLFFSAGPGLTINRAAGERIDFTVSAADGRALSQVRFFLNGTNRLTDTAAPFQFSWVPTLSDPAGNYVLVAEATDTAGNKATESRTLTLLASTCAIYVSSATPTQGQSIDVQGLCSASQTLDKMEFFVDDILQSPYRDPATPYTWRMDTSAFAVGTHTVRVRAVRADTALGEDRASIEILAAPLTLTFSPGMVVNRTEDLSVTAAATDGRALRQVSFYVNGEFRAGEQVAPYRLTLLGSGQFARPDRLGLHQLYVEATDMDGNVLTATRDLYVLSDICNVLVATSKYRVSSHDTVLVGPHTVIQGQLLPMQGLCSASQNVQQIDFYVDAVLQVTDVSAPYGFAMTTASLQPGSHTVSITARFAGGGVANHSIPIEIVAPRP